MPTATQKARRLLSKGKKLERRARFEAQRDMAREVATVALDAHGCACAYCQYRVFRKSSGHPDPGPNPVESPEDCVEAFTVRVRGDKLLRASTAQVVTRNRAERRARKHRIREAIQLSRAR